MSRSIRKHEHDEENRVINKSRYLHHPPEAGEERAKYLEHHECEEYYRPVKMPHILNT